MCGNAANVGYSYCSSSSSSSFPSSSSAPSSSPSLFFAKVLEFNLTHSVADLHTRVQELLVGAQEEGSDAAGGGNGSGSSGGGGGNVGVGG